MEIGSLPFHARAPVYVEDDAVPWLRFITHMTWRSQDDMMTFACSGTEPAFDAALTSFVAHHLRGAEEKGRFLAGVRRRLRPGGTLYVVDVFRKDQVGSRSASGQRHRQGQVHSKVQSQGECSLRWHNIGSGLKCRYELATGVVGRMCRMLWVQRQSFARASGR